MRAAIVNHLDFAPDGYCPTQAWCAAPIAVRAGLPRTLPAAPTPEEDPTCRQACLEAEREMHRRQAAHLGFQRLLGAGANRDAELNGNLDLRLHLNPIRVWARLDRAVRVHAAEEPFTEVLFFAAGNAIRAAVLEPKARAILNVLAWFCPCTLRQFRSLNQHSSRAEIERFCRDLAQVGLVAFSS